MFFAPPKVKSLSLYSEFGTYLNSRHFLGMVAAASLIHAAAFGAYALFPREQVVRIPVRVMNLKFSDEMTGGDAAEQPAYPAVSEAVLPPQEKVAEPVAAKDKTGAQAMLDKAFERPAAPPPATGSEKEIVDDTKKAASAKAAKASKELTLKVPKRFVRGQEEEKPAADAAGTEAASQEKATQDIVQRYEQAISLWIQQHQIYPESLRSQGVKGDAVVRVRVNREGKIVYSVIDQSSGNAALDHAVMAMVRASDPVPPVPDNYPAGAEFEFLVPVSYRLQQ